MELCRLGPGQGPLVDSKWIAQVTEQSQAAMKQRQPTQEEVLEVWTCCLIVAVGAVQFPVVFWAMRP